MPNAALAAARRPAGQQVRFLVAVFSCFALAARIGPRGDARTAPTNLCQYGRQLRLFRLPNCARPRRAGVQTAAKDRRLGTDSRSWHPFANLIQVVRRVPRFHGLVEQIIHSAGATATTPGSRDAGLCSEGRLLYAPAPAATVTLGGPRQTAKSPSCRNSHHAQPAARSI